MHYVAVNRVVDIINAGWLLLLCALPFVLSGIVLDNSEVWCVLCVIWIFPLFCYIIDCFPRLSLYMRILLNRNLSKGGIYLLAIQYSIIAIVLVEYGFLNVDVFANMKPWEGASIGILLISYLLMNIWIIKGFILVPVDEPDKLLTKPLYDAKMLTADAQQVLTAVNEYSDAIKGNSILGCSGEAMQMAVCIIARDFLIDIVEELEQRMDMASVETADVIRRYIPSIEQMNSFPKESLGLLLSSQSYVCDNVEQDCYYDMKLMNEICIAHIAESTI